MKAIHKIKDVVILGLQSLTRHIVRSLLTIMGILFGVWSVIAMLGMNEGMARQAQSELEKLGSDNLIIESRKPSDTSKGSNAGAPASIYGLSYADVRRLRDNIPRVVRCIVVHLNSKDAAVDANRVTTTVIGTEPAYMEATRLKLLPGGRFITDADILRQRNVCVITAELARKLYAYQDPLGRPLRLETEPFIVVGVVEHPAYIKSSAGNPAEASNQIFVPVSADRQRFGEVKRTIMPGSFTMEMVSVSQCILRMADDQAVIGGSHIARNLLQRYHPEEDYEVTVPLELIEQKKAQSRLWNIMFFAIASVSLLVGGIGIMNIMLASVTERTREIGVRRALGAKRRDIVVQFLVESVTLTTVGGLLGILVGAVAVPLLVRWLLHMEAVVSGVTLIVPFAMALSVGLGSGLYPAMRAAKLDPIIALRHE